MQTFYELIRVAIGNADNLSHIPSNKEWFALYNMAKKQSLVGICFAALQKLALQRNENEYENRIQSKEPGAKPAEDHTLEPCEVMAKYWNMPEMLYLKWMGMAAKIQQKNELMNAKTKEALAFFREKGFPCHVLKGQGIAKLYQVYEGRNTNDEKSINHKPSSINLQGLRQSGDIDVWLAGGREKVYQLSREVLGEITGANYHHIHFPIWDEPEIEAHIYPSFLSSPYRNWQLHKFCKIHEPRLNEERTTKDEGLDAPSIDFNLVFIMLHCYRHLCGHGVGMRQVMDYYFVLRASYEERKTKDETSLTKDESSLTRNTKDERRRMIVRDSLVNNSSSVKDDSLLWIERLGMNRFAPALMWVMKEVFGMEDEYLLCEPDEKEGKFLLNEIMNTGNMGHGETRFQWGQESPLGRFVAAQKRNLHLATHYPHEVLWSPLFNIWRFFWLKTKLR